ncbi:MAG: PIN domain-containing protein [Firmicutes bacterium]|nr:PIN domain-containing protein [Bacillota bacterium]
MKESVLVDAGAILALLCRDDRNHLPARAILKQMQKRRALPVLTNYIVAEAHGLLNARLGRDAARMWVRGNIWPVERAGEEDEQRALEILFSGRGGDCTMTDAVSLAVMERLGIGSVFTFARHFGRYGCQVLSADIT